MIDRTDINITDALGRLQVWYLNHCDGDWEHSYGVRIDTLDNPGWSLTVDLTGTELETRPFTSRFYGITEDEALQGKDGDVSWHVCRRNPEQFIAYGGPRDLLTLINVFVCWAEEP